MPSAKALPLMSSTKMNAVGMPLEDDDLGPEPSLPQTKPRWCLVLMPNVPIRILALTEDCVGAAQERGWIVLGRDSDVLSSGAAT